MSVGFDVLGAAVTPVDGALLGDVVTVEAAETFSLNNLGRFADKLPSEPRENIVYQCWEDGALLGDVVTVEAAETFSLNNLGRFADKLPSEPRENIVYQCWERFCQ